MNMWMIVNTAANMYSKDLAYFLEYSKRTWIHLHVFIIQRFLKIYIFITTFDKEIFVI